MISHDEQWWILQSGEYVLGTLAGPERDTFTKLLEHDAEARRYVVWWQERLAHLDSSVVKVMPPAHIWQRLCQQLNFSTERYQADAAVTSVTPEASSAQLQQQPARGGALGRRLTLWRGLAGLATAASLLMAVALWQNHGSQSAQDGLSYDAISIIADEGGSTLWVINVAQNAEQYKVAAVAPPELDSDKSYELWLVSADQQTVSSLGLIPSVAGESLLLQVDRQADKDTAFAVSLEQKGGSTGAGPTGPVMFNGTLQQLRSPQN